MPVRVCRYGAVSGANGTDIHVIHRLDRLD